ncbi:unnamed protein product [Discula destructiva]
MSAPPLLRPLRAILQRRLHLVSSRPIQTPYLVRSSHYRHQLRYNSSIPPDQPPKSEDPAQQAPSEQSHDSDSTPTATLAEDTQNAASAETPAGSSLTSTAQADAETPVTTSFHILGHSEALHEAAIPRLDSERVTAVFQQLKSTDAEIQTGIAEAVARQLEADDAEPSIQEASQVVGNVSEVTGAQESEPTPLTAEMVELQNETVQQDPAQQAATSKTPSPDAAPAQPAAPPGLEALKNASPEQVAAMMAYLQTLQAANTANAKHEAPQEQQQQVPEPVVSESSTPASPVADAVAAMTKPVDPAEQTLETIHSAETPALDPSPIERVSPEPMEAESDFVVDPILAPGEQAVQDMAQEVDGLKEMAEAALNPEPEAVSITESTQSALGDAAVDMPILDGQTDTLESAVEAERAASELDEEVSCRDDSIDAAVAEALDKDDRDAHAAQLAQDGKGKQKAAGVASRTEPSRLPRNVAAYYLQPLRRVAEYGVPACDLQLRSYSIRPLESFCDFALRAAYYLGLPAYGPVPLPKIIERWTVPRSHFIFKKSQENFERITRRRLIQIKDANPETVQIWLAFLQKHQQAAVGMKANLWEFSSIDVAKQLDEAYKQAEPMIKDKFRLLVQKKEFETVEKVDEFLHSERYRLTGDRVERKQ